MAPRPRATTDADLLMAVHRAVSRIGPARMTLAHVAAEAGVAPATLVQRFGSKRGLLLALVEQGSAAAEQAMADIRNNPSPLGGLRDFADCMAGMASTPEELANHLAFLHTDLTDPDFHVHALAQARAHQNELKALLDAAVKARELRRCDTNSLARLVQEMLHGSLVTWAIYRQGDAQTWLRRDLEALLAPYNAAKARSRAGPARQRRRK